MECITVLDLYRYAKDHNLLDARIRITDGEAVSLYPHKLCLARGVYELVIDVSDVEPLSFDELDDFAKRVRYDD